MTNKEIIAKFHHQPELSVDFDLDCWRIAQRISLTHQMGTEIPALLS
ncbi:MAG: hypothetical protein IPO77_03155 [Acidobacteria bacterium]|nr:hypothetical protein [Acidobacteriota bacterium]